MEGRYFPQRVVSKFSLMELVFDVMRYAQQCHGVIDFPLFTDRRWHLFIYYAQDDLGKLAFPLLEVDFLWDGINPMIENRDDILCKLEAALFATTLPVNGQPDRMRLDTACTARGNGFGEKFNELAEVLYQTSQLIEGFAPST